MNVDLPVFLFMTLVGVKDYSLSTHHMNKIFPSTRKTYKIDKNILNFPEIIIETYAVDIKKMLKPWFDLLWNACGYDRCFDYDNG